MKKRILALGAHYDDIEIGVAGTLLKHIERGDDIFFAVTVANDFRGGDAARRYHEQLKSLKLFRLSKENLRLFDQDDPIDDTVCNLDRINPDTIYTMFEFGTHQQHRQCSYIGQAVGRKLSTQVIFYNSGSSYDFNPNTFSFIDVWKKNKILSCFESQIKRNTINLDIIRRRDSNWASLMTEEKKIAEGFIIKKMEYML